VKYPSAQAQGFYKGVPLWATSWPGNVVTGTPGGRDSGSSVSPGARAKR
jgi:hypothetical protein